MKISEALSFAKEKISKPENWCKGALFKDVNDKAVYSKKILGDGCLDANTVKFCATGVIFSLQNPVLEDKCFNALAKAIMLIEEKYINYSLSNYNDNSKHFQVMELFDKAIELAKQEEI